MKLIAILAALVASQEKFASDECRVMANGLATDCGTDTDIFQLESFALDRAPKIGESISAHFIGNLKEEIGKGSTIKISSSLNGFKFPIVTQDLCKQAKKEGVNCPHQAKPQKFDLKLSYPIPIIAPKGSYQIEVTGFSDSKARIFRSKFSIQL